MRTKSIVLIIIALGCGLVASIGISEVLKQGPGAGPAVETEPLLVAAMDIDIGTKLDAQNVKIEQWPKGKIPEEALHSLDDAQDHFTSTRLYAGEPILSKKLMDSNDPSATTKIPDGYLVLPVKVELDTVIGLIQPGDLVDIMVFLRQGAEIPRTDTYTILRMVRVFAVNSQTARTVDEKGHEVSAKTVSLLVKPKQSEKLTLAAELGKIRLALRRPTDQIPDDNDLDKDLPSIFRNGQGYGMDKKQEKAAEPTIVPTPVVVAPPPMNPAPVPPEPIGPAWTMKIMTPNEVRQFDWATEKALPTEAPTIPLGGTTTPLPVQGSVPPPGH